MRRQIRRRAVRGPRGPVQFEWINDQLKVQTEERTPSNRDLAQFAYVASHNAA
jgi:hypothetical protein